MLYHKVVAGAFKPYIAQRHIDILLNLHKFVGQPAVPFAVFRLEHKSHCGDRRFYLMYPHSVIFVCRLQAVCGFFLKGNAVIA